MAATPVVADTHAIVWYLAQAKTLSAPAFLAIDSALLAGEPVYVSAISLIELQYLVEHGRVPEHALRDLIAASEDPEGTLTIIPVGTEIAEALTTIPRHKIADMPDRIVAATAAFLDVPLVTADQKIRQAGCIRTIW